MTEMQTVFDNGRCRADVGRPRDMGINGREHIWFWLTKLSIKPDGSDDWHEYPVKELAFGNSTANANMLKHILDGNWTELLDSLGKPAAVWVFKRTVLRELKTLQ